MMRLTIFLLALLIATPGCNLQNYQKRGYDSSTWEQSPTLHDVPEEFEPLPKKEIDNKEKELRKKYQEKSVGFTVVNPLSR